MTENVFNAEESGKHLPGFKFQNSLFTIKRKNYFLFKSKFDQEKTISPAKGNRLRLNYSKRP